MVEGVVVQQVQIHDRRGVLGCRHRVGGEVGEDVHVVVTRDGGVAGARGVRLGRVAAEFSSRGHHQAEVAARLVVHLVHSHRGEPVIHVDDLQRAVGGRFGRRRFVIYILSDRHILGPVVGQVVGAGAVGPGAVGGQVAHIHQLHLFVLIADQHAELAVDAIVVAGGGGRQHQFRVCQREVVHRVDASSCVSVAQGQLLVALQRVGVRVGLDHRVTATHTLADRPHAVGGAIVEVGILGGGVAGRWVESAFRPGHHLSVGARCLEGTHTVGAGAHESAVLHSADGVGEFDTAAVLRVGRDNGVGGLLCRDEGKTIDIRIFAVLDEVNIDTVVQHHSRHAAQFVVAVQIAQLVAHRVGSLAHRAISRGRGVAAGHVGSLGQHQVVVGPDVVAVEVHLADVGHRGLHVNHVVAHAVQRIHTVDGHLVAQVGADGVRRARVGDGRVVQPQLVGTLDSAQLAGRFAGRRVHGAVVAYVDAVVDITAVGRGTGTDNAVHDVHQRQLVLRAVHEGVVALAIHDDAAHTAEDVGFVEVGVTHVVAPVGATVDGGLQLQLVRVEGCHQAVREAGFELGIGAVLSVEGHAPQRALVDGIHTHVHIHRAVNIAQVAAAIHVALHRAACKVQHRRRAHGRAVLVPALAGVAVVHVLRAAIHALGHRAAFHVQHLQAIHRPLHLLFRGLFFTLAAGVDALVEGAALHVYYNI